MSRVVSKVGLRFGRWVVQDLASTNPTKWRCICDCGTVKEVIGTNLRSPGAEMSKSFGSRSCVCYRNELAMGRAKTHGYASSGKASRTYRLWASMLHRTRNKNSRSRAIYMDRGISVCERWFRFENFLSDMGERPSPAHTIDRIDNDKGYSPDNCRWATKTEQARNRRNNRKVEAFGERLTVSEWSERFGIVSGTIIGRLNNGWSNEDAVSQSPIPQGERQNSGPRGPRTMRSVPIVARAIADLGIFFDMDGC